jgi:hypothetical protein
MLGRWIGTDNSDAATQILKTITIDSVDGANFSGKRTIEVKHGAKAKIITSISGYFDNGQFFIKNTKVLYKKDPPNGGWIDCSDCMPQSSINIQHDSVILISRIENCKRECNNISVYYKMLCDFDTVTQRFLVNHFASAMMIKNFMPCIKKSPELIAQEQKRITDSLKNAALIAKEKQLYIDDSLQFVAALNKKEQKHIEDSIRLLKHKQQQQINDSLQLVAAVNKKQQQHLDDSVQLVAAVAKKQQKHIEDSISFAKKKQQQLIKDSLQNAAIFYKQRQQRINDSLKIAAVAINKTPVVPDTARTSTTKDLEARDNVLLETYHIGVPDILIELFDNAQIDGDRVSVYHNKELIVSNKMLLREPITIKIHADTANRKHEFVMIAENLGSIAPNTALMRITVGKQVYKLSVKTDLQTNARILFYYDGN